MRDRQRLSKFCLRLGRLLPTTAWTVTRRAWLGQQRFERAAAQLTFDTYLHAVDLVDHRIDALEQAIREVAARGPWRQLVARLRCLRGVDTHTALALVAEIGDFGRFASAEEFMAFVGLVPSERSSGEQRRQGSITKVGNAHVRRLLVESAWHARRRPTVGYQLARRQRGQDAIVIERAWRLPAATAPALAADGRTRQTAAKDRRRLRPRARRLRLGDRHRSTTQESLIQPLGLEQRMRPTTRRTLAASMRHRPPVTRDLRPRQLPTVPLHAAPTRECQSDPPSLLRTIRCSRPRAQPHLPSRT
jgi:hypothetical protein